MSRKDIIGKPPKPMPVDLRTTQTEQMTTALVEGDDIGVGLPASDFFDLHATTSV